MSVVVAVLLFVNFTGFNALRQESFGELFQLKKRIFVINTLLL